MAVDPIKDGFNWYQYCYSNPLRYWDPLGLVPVVASQQDDENDDGFSAYTGCASVSSVARWQDPSTANYEVIHDFKGTVTIGISYLKGLGGAGGASIGLSMDGESSKLQFALVGGGGTPSQNLPSIFVMVTNAPDVDALTGMAYQVGGSVSYKASVGFDYYMMHDSETGERYDGYSLALSVGSLSAEVHGLVGYTWNIFTVEE